MEYRYLTTSLEGFVQQLACNILPHGYWFYVRGSIPDGKDPLSIDAKLLDRYGIAISRQQRSRRKLQGLANLHYLRLGRLWFIFATHGKHPFFEQEQNNIRDARKVPVLVGGYSLSVKQGGFLRKTSKMNRQSPMVRCERGCKSLEESFETYAATFLRSPATGPQSRLRRNCLDYRMSPMHQSDGSS